MRREVPKREGDSQGGERLLHALYLENLKNNYLSGHCVSPAANGHPKAER